jgi:hypothetical protein
MKAVAIVLVFGVFAVAGLVAQTPPDSVELKGSPMGAVKFNHKAHTDGGWSCEVCHHASKPEKPLGEVRYQACRDCHSKAIEKPMKTKVAFHAVGAKSGICVDCHLAEKKGPSKCSDCHKKAPA